MKSFNWVCPKCGNRVGVGVVLKQPPTCINHLGKTPVEMKEQNEQFKPNSRMD
jgi:hypothetical protein